MKIERQIEYVEAVVTGFLLVVGVTSTVILLVDFLGNKWKSFSYFLD